MSPPELLYHYTDAAGLLGLIGRPGTGPEIWLTQIQFMNDQREWWHAFDLMKSVVADMQKDHRPELQRLGEFIAPDKPAFTATPAANLAGFPRTFVFSLTEHGDLLSQWRGYTPSGGYSVGFDSSSLQKIAHRNGLRLVKCIYDEAEKNRQIRLALDSIVSEIRESRVAPHLSDTDHSLEQKVLASAHYSIQLVFRRFGAYFKHPSFIEEAEWRLVGNVAAGGTDPRERYRTRRDLILPYSAVPLAPKDGEEFVVRSVITGPGVDYELAAHSIHFSNYGRYKNLRVHRSKSTLRR